MVLNPELTRGPLNLEEGVVFFGKVEKPVHRAAVKRSRTADRGRVHRGTEAARYL